MKFFKAFFQLLLLWAFAVYWFLRLMVSVWLAPHWVRVAVYPPFAKKEIKRFLPPKNLFLTRMEKAYLLRVGIDGLSCEIKRRMVQIG